MGAAVGAVAARPAISPVLVALARGGCICAAVVALLAGDAGIARAEPSHLMPDGQFEAAGALGVAVDNSSSASDPARGDVYAAGYLSVIAKTVLEQEAVLGQISQFDGSGKLLAPPSPFGEAGVYAGAAVNPANGDLFALKVLNLATFSFEPTVEVLEPGSGSLVGSFSVEPSANQPSGFGNFTVVGIAADSEGNVYVPVAPKNEVLEYDPATCLEEQAKGEPPPCKPRKTFTGGSGSGALKHPTGVAVDPAGNVWVADTGNGRIEELSPSDAPVLGGVISSEGVGSVAVDAHGNVFAIVDNGRDFCGAIQAPCSHLVEYDSTGAQVADLGAGTIGAKQFGPEFGAGRLHEPLPDMAAVSDATGEVYVSEPVFEVAPGVSAGQVWKYRAPSAPAIGGGGKDESAVEVGASTAKLGAIVSPGGAAASYRFEYGTTASYGNSVPSPEGDTGTGFASRTVWAGVSGLSPGSTYHYRVVLTGEAGGAIVGEDHTFTTGTAATCPNEAFRTGFSANLPDCRAYELVMPSSKNGAQPDPNKGGNGPGELELTETLKNNRAAADAEGDGNRLAFWAEDVLPGSQSAGFDYVATRGAAGWSAQNVFPSTDSYGFKCPQELVGAVYSEDLSKAIIGVPIFGHVGPGECRADPEVVSGEPRGVENYFVRDNTTGAYELVDAPETGVEGFVPATPSLLGESPDLSRIVFSEQATLTKGAPASADDLYEWSAGHVALVTVLPDGTPVSGSYVKNGISADGSRVFFTAQGNLYARVDGRETLQLDESQAGGPGGGATFVKASHDGSVVLFTDGDAARLTSDTVPGSGTNLYRYEAAAPAGRRLTDLTPVAKAETPVVGGMSKDGSVVYFTDDASAAVTSTTVSGSGGNLYRYDTGAPSGLSDLTPLANAEVQTVFGVAEDGSSVYFTAKGELTSVANKHGEKAHPGESNMYLSRGATSNFIAPGGGGTVSANGAFLLFGSTASLTGYDNFDPSTGTAAGEFYLYDAAQSSLACASCNASGAPPTPFAVQLGGTFAGGPDEGLETRTPTPRQLTDKGQVFFDSAEELLPADTNGRAGCPSDSGFPRCTDVYEFEPEGAGRPACSQAAGCLSLLSTGTGSLETFFIDASPSGNDVFIREFQKLVPGDTEEGAPSLYDVRVDGGFPEGSPSSCATADACRAAPAPQPGGFGAPASQTFSGAGNLGPTPPNKPKALTNAQRLAKALATCRKRFPHNKKKRHACEKQAHNTYPAKTAANRAKKAGKTNRGGTR